MNRSRRRTARPLSELRRCSRRTVDTGELGNPGSTVASIPWLGSILSMVAICILLPLLWGERRPKVLIPFAVIFPAFITLLFAYLLGVHFEPGVFDFTIR